jgi:hypothetical protein
MRDRVERVRSLLREATKKPSRPQSVDEAQQRKAFELYEFNSSPPVLLEQSHRARSEREISRIASWYGWQAEIARALDAGTATCLADLDDDSIDELLTRMRKLEQCVQDGLDPPDSAPAR